MDATPFAETPGPTPPSNRGWKFIKCLVGAALVSMFLVFVPIFSALGTGFYYLFDSLRTATIVHMSATFAVLIFLVLASVCILYNNVFGGFYTQVARADRWGRRITVITLMVAIFTLFVVGYIRDTTSLSQHRVLEHQKVALTPPSDINRQNAVSDTTRALLYYGRATERLSLPSCITEAHTWASSPYYTLTINGQPARPEACQNIANVMNYNLRKVN